MKVISKQTNSKMCIICGLDNAGGVKANFYNMEDGSLGCLCQFKEEHQSYPGRVHGGMIGALLDEVMGRVLWVKTPDKYAVTTTMNIKYRKPVPYNTPLKCRAIITKTTSRMYGSVAMLYDQADNLLAEAEGNYLILPSNVISDGVNVDNEMCYNIKDNITQIDFVVG